MMNYIFLVSILVLLCITYVICTKRMMKISFIVAGILWLIESNIIAREIQKRINPAFCKKMPIIKWVIAEGLGATIVLCIVLAFAVTLFKVYKQKKYEKNK